MDIVEKKRMYHNHVLTVKHIYKEYLCSSYNLDILMNDGRHLVGVPHKPDIKQEVEIIDPPDGKYTTAFVPIKIFLRLKDGTETEINPFEISSLGWENEALFH